MRAYTVTNGTGGDIKTTTLRDAKLLADNAERHAVLTHQKGGFQVEDEEGEGEELYRARYPLITKRGHNLGYPV